MKRALIGLVVFTILYHVHVIYNLVNGHILHAVAFYTNPPHIIKNPFYGELSFSRLPILFSDQISLKILKYRGQELTNYMRKNSSIANMFNPIENNGYFDEKEATNRTLRIFDITTENGLRLNTCERDGSNPVDTLRKYNMLSEQIYSYFKERLTHNELTKCHRT
ncbi:hypothetical protein [Endozoicomonas elysicola]|uniref:Uncharacterized protein n=1 Tax=Endozoicomonas elysicola TaxID=305900 RepID=A0A081KDU6_9GAMM|nr:hypothetical protein [Endozoicomonas elysicola]KEI72322.1 hypothetical protein GV64_17730 [Endozoicomonas elysicola]